MQMELGLIEIDVAKNLLPFFHPFGRGGSGWLHFYYRLLVVNLVRAYIVCRCTRGFVCGLQQSNYFRVALVGHRQFASAVDSASDRFVLKTLAEWV